MLATIGVSIWQMAVTISNPEIDAEPKHIENGYLNNNVNEDSDGETSASDGETSASDEESDASENHEEPVNENPLVALACDDGCVRIYSISNTDELLYVKSFPRVSGEISTLYVMLLCKVLIYMYFQP